MEEWKPVKGYEGLYEVSTEGRLRTHNWKGSGRTVVMKPAKDTCGYLRTMLVKNGEAHTIKMHRIIAETFLENPNNCTDVNHIDGDKTNNRIENLEWCTHKENSAHAVRTGLYDNSIKTVLFYNQMKQIAVEAIDKNDVVTRYESLSEAERRTGIWHTQIRLVLDGKKEEIHGYRFRYA